MTASRNRPVLAWPSGGHSRLALVCCRGELIQSDIADEFVGYGIPDPGERSYGRISSR